MAKQIGSWVRVTYAMPAKRKNGTAVKIRTGSEARVEAFKDGIYICRIGDVSYSVTEKDLEANGPRDLHDMFKF